MSVFKEGMCEKCKEKNKGIDYKYDMELCAKCEHWLLITVLDD